MKKITLELDDSVVGKLRSALATKMMTGNYAGILDVFIKRLIDHIDEDKEEWKIEKKSDNEKNEK